MLNSRKFLNFIDLPNYQAGQKLNKLPVEQAIKAASHALNQGKSRVIVSGIPHEIRHSKNGNPYFRIHGSIPVEAWVIYNESDAGHFVRLDLGIIGEDIQQTKGGISHAESSLVSITGRVKDTRSGDPSVYFYDHEKAAYMKGFVDALDILQQIAEKQGEDIKHLVVKKLREKIETNGEQLPW